jgi:hypothetical protein
MLMRERQSGEDHLRRTQLRFEAETSQVALGSRYPGRARLHKDHSIEASRREVQKSSGGCRICAVELAYESTSGLQARHGHLQFSQHQSIEVQLLQIRGNGIVAKTSISKTQEHSVVLKLARTVLNVSWLQKISSAICSPQRLPI